MLPVRLFDEARDRIISGLGVPQHAFTATTTAPAWASIDAASLQAAIARVDALMTEQREAEIVNEYQNDWSQWSRHSILSAREYREELLNSPLPVSHPRTGECHWWGPAPSRNTHMQLNAAILLHLSHDDDDTALDTDVAESVVHNAERPFWFSRELAETALCGPGAFSAFGSPVL